EHSTAITGNVSVAHTAKLAASTFPFAFRSKDSFAQQTGHFRTIGPHIDRLVISYNSAALSSHLPILQQSKFQPLSIPVDFFQNDADSLQRFPESTRTFRLNSRYWLSVPDTTASVQVIGFDREHLDDIGDIACSEHGDSHVLLDNLGRLALLGRFWL